MSNSISSIMKFCTHFNAVIDMMEFSSDSWGTQQLLSHHAFNQKEELLDKRKGGQIMFSGGLFLQDSTQNYKKILFK